MDPGVAGMAQWVLIYGGSAPFLIHEVTEVDDDFYAHHFMETVARQLVQVQPHTGPDQGGVVLPQVFGSFPCLALGLGRVGSLDMSLTGEGQFREILFQRKVAEIEPLGFNSSSCPRVWNSIQP